MRPALAALALALWAPAALAQDLTVVGLDGAEKTLSAQAISALPRASVEAAWGATYEGPRLAHVLRAAGAPVGARLHGEPLMAHLVVTGADGFSAVYSLAEVDADFHDGRVVLADTAEGAKLSDKQAPFRLVAAGDRKPWRSVYAVTRIELRSAKSLAP